MIPQLTYRRKDRPSDAELIAAFHATYSLGEDGIPRWRNSGCGRSAGKLAGHDDGKGYLSIVLMGQRYKLHRVIWMLHYGNYPMGMVDHINGNRRDNRIDNLRLATAAQSVHNRMRTGRLGTGVSKNARGRYCARIQANGEKVYLGYYDTPAEAAAAYAGASIVLRGEYALRLSREPRPDGLLMGSAGAPDPS